MNTGTLLQHYPEIRLRRGANTKMLCPDCGSLQPTEFQNERGLVYLSCKHLRTPALLDPHPGHLSLEHVIAGDPLALSLFPAIDIDGFRQRGRDITDVIGDVDREHWAWAA